MTNFRDFFNKLFPDKSGAKNVVINEVISRSSAYQNRFESWAATDQVAECYSGVAAGYHAKLLSEENDGIQVHLLKSQYANGFTISYHDSGMNKEEFSFLFDHLAEKVRKLDGYRRVNADYMISEKQNYVETKEKYYLKPIVTPEDRIVNQRFGNILIEHILNDDKPIYIKLTANVYSDSNYREAQSFEELMRYLLS